MHCAGPGSPHRAIVPLPLSGVAYKYLVDQKWRISSKEMTVNSSEVGKAGCQRVQQGSCLKRIPGLGKALARVH